MTYGGSNTITNLTAVGLALAVGARALSERDLGPSWQERPRRTDVLDATVTGAAPPRGR
jgi:hypothetical protein